MWCVGRPGPPRPNQIYSRTVLDVQPLYLCKWCHCVYEIVSFKGGDLGWEAAVGTGTSNQKGPVLKKNSYLRWPLYDEHGAMASFMNSSRIRISAVLKPVTEDVTGINIWVLLRVRFGGLLLILLLINRFPVSQKHVRWNGSSWSWEGHISTCCFSVPLNEARFIMKRLPLNPEESQSNINILPPSEPHHRCFWNSW